MPRRDAFHYAVRNALIKDGWTITDDPYIIEFAGQSLAIDLGAEMPFAAEKATSKIAVEVKTFSGKSPTTDLERTLGQHLLYKRRLERIEPARILYVAVSAEIYVLLFTHPDWNDIIETAKMRLIVCEIEQEVIEKWIELPNSEA